MRTRELPNVNIDYLDNMLLRNGRMRLLSVGQFREVPHDHLLVWAQKRGRYGFPTRELIEFLRATLGRRRVIEIGAGMGDLGAHVEMTMTDSHMQTRPDIAQLYMAMGAAAIAPPSDVEKLTAYDAVRKYKPQVVVASWVTQLYQPGDEGHGENLRPAKKIGSSVYGVDEFDILKNCETYIHIGNRDVHGDKRLLNLPHAEIEADFLVSRGFDQSKNVIYIWNRDGATQ